MTRSEKKPGPKKTTATKTRKTTPASAAAPSTKKSAAQKSAAQKFKKVSVTVSESAALKQKVFEAFLAQVPTWGWTEKALEEGAKAAGKSPEFVWALFPEKETDALKTWARFLNAAAQEKLMALDLKSMKVRERIFWGVKTHLSFMANHKSAASKAFRFLLTPAHLPLAISCLYDTVHTLWVLAGDSSTDYNFYTKRGLLAGVYLSAFLYWLKDTSPEHYKTNQFIEKRIENVLLLQKAKDLKSIMPDLNAAFPLKAVSFGAKQLWRLFTQTGFGTSGSK